MIKKLNVLKTVIQNNKIRLVLNTVKINNNEAATTNLNDVMFCNIEKETGLYDTKGFSVTKVLVDREYKNVSIDDFPAISSKLSDYRSICNIDIVELKKSLELLKNYTASEENVSLAGVHFNVFGDKIELVSSNTYVLAKKEIKTNAEFECNFTVKNSGVKALLAILKYEKKGTIEILNYNDKYCFVSENFKLFTKEIDLHFVDYTDLLKRFITTDKVELDRIELLRVLKNHLPVARNNQESKNASVFNIIDSNFHIRTINPATRLDDTIDCISSSNLKISLNIVFLINYLKNVDDRITELHFTNSDSAVILKNDNTLLVQMPLAVRDDM